MLGLRAFLMVGVSVFVEGLGLSEEGEGFTRGPGVGLRVGSDIDFFPGLSPLDITDSPRSQYVLGLAQKQMQKGKN